MPRARVVNLRHERYDVYVGRPGHGEPGPFGNPFRVGQDGDRDEVIAKYRRYFLARIEMEPAFREQALALRGLRLGCFCAPFTCHADVIVEWLNALPEP